MLGAWMLNEASGARVNAQGTTSRNLSPVGSVANDTVNKVEGPASAAMASGGMALQTTDSAVVTPAAPFAMSIWVRPSAPLSGYVLQSANFPNGFRLGFSSNTITYQPFTGASTAAPAASTADVWTHIAVVQTTATACTLYVNGIIATTNASGCAYTSQSTNPFSIGSWSSDTNVAGQFDEAVVATQAWAGTTVCRICSCGVRGELCTCNGAAFVTVGRNATSCGSCTLPSNCSVATPP